MTPSRNASARSQASCPLSGFSAGMAPAAVRTSWSTSTATTWSTASTAEPRGGAAAARENARQAPGIADASCSRRWASAPSRTGVHRARQPSSVSTIPGRKRSRATIAPAKRSTSAQKARSFETTSPEASVSRPTAAHRTITAWAGDSATVDRIHGTRREAAAPSAGALAPAVRRGLEGSGRPATVGSQATRRSASPPAIERPGTASTSAAESRDASVS